MHDPFDFVSSGSEPKQSLLTVSGAIEKERNKLLIMAFFVFILAPIISVTFVTSTDESPLYASISRLGWALGKKGFMYAWGAIMLGTIGAVNWLGVDKSALPKQAKDGFKWGMVVACMLVLIGSFIPANDGTGDTVPVAGQVHNAFSAAGLGGIAIVDLIYCIAVFKYGKLEQAVATAGAMAFIIISGVFTIFVVRDFSSYCMVSGVAQIYIFNALSVFSYIAYCQNYSNWKQALIAKTDV